MHSQNPVCEVLGFIVSACYAVFDKVSFISVKSQEKLGNLPQNFLLLRQYIRCPGKIMELGKEQVAICTGMKSYVLRSRINHDTLKSLKMQLLA